MLVLPVLEIERFWSLVDRREKGSCWPWLAGRTGAGYGQFCTQGKILYAHRVSHELAKGQIPDGLNVLHSCDNPPCCNPEHLDAGTQYENMLQKIERGRYTALRGEESPMSKLMERDVLRIRAMYATGQFSQRKLGRLFGVTHKGIGYVLNEGWKHAH